jgi:hypothetical protein
MGKYFFDRIWHDQAEYDFQGREFAAPAEARELAELIALDLEIEADDRWAGWAVDVRNAHNERFFTIPVRGPRRYPDPSQHSKRTEGAFRAGASSRLRCCE